MPVAGPPSGSEGMTVRGEEPGFDISEAIVVYLWNYPGKNDVEFRERFGDAEALAAVRATLDETMRAPIDMAGRTLVEIGADVGALMHERHPDLSEPALKKLGNFFTYLVK